MKYIIFTLLLFALPCGASTEKNRQRIEELFLWKVTDSLNLDLKKSEKVKKIVTEIGKKRNKANSELQKVVKGLEKSKGKNTDQLMKKYEQALDDYYKCQKDELKKLRPILEEEKLAQYVVLKHQFVSRLKNVLSSQEPSAPSKKLKEPEITFEK